MRFYRRPDFIIGGEENPYLLRWYLIPRNNWLNVYLHKFVRDDDDRALHDHPWWFVSIMIRGGYREYQPLTNSDPLASLLTSHIDFETGDGPIVGTYRAAPSIAFRRATQRHRVALDYGKDGKPIPCWTIVITGPKVRDWGFWCPRGFVPWREFTDGKDGERVGKGCD